MDVGVYLVFCDVVEMMLRGTNNETIKRNYKNMHLNSVHSGLDLQCISTYCLSIVLLPPFSCSVPRTNEIRGEEVIKVRMKTLLL